MSGFDFYQQIDIAMYVLLSTHKGAKESQSRYAKSSDRFPALADRLCRFCLVTNWNGHLGQQTPRNGMQLPA
jgi:hypothetical protein